VLVEQFGGADARERRDRLLVQRVDAAGGDGVDDRGEQVGDGDTVTSELARVDAGDVVGSAAVWLLALWSAI
jgi:hypothetical protein